MLALLVGPFQLLEPFRNRYRKAHRMMGKAYVAGTSGGGVCALVLASTTALAMN